MRELDPVGTALRWRRTFCWRKYNVRCPNALWHIDGKHKMIRWWFVTHRLWWVFQTASIPIRCKQQQKLRHSLWLSQNACQTYGIPSRVTSDHGLKNVGVARKMLECHGVNRGSMTTGSSVHNQRAERLHRMRLVVFLGAIEMSFRWNHLVCWMN